MEKLLALESFVAGVMNSDEDFTIGAPHDCPNNAALTVHQREEGKGKVVYINKPAECNSCPMKLCAFNGKYNEAILAVVVNGTVYLTELVRMNVFGIYGYSILEKLPANVKLFEIYTHELNKELCAKHLPDILPSENVERVLLGLADADSEYIEYINRIHREMHE